MGVHVRGTGNLHSEDAAVSFPWRQAGVKQFTDRDKEITNHICEHKYHVDWEQFIKCFEKYVIFVLFYFILFIYFNKMVLVINVQAALRLQQTSRTLPRVSVQQRHLAAAGPQLFRLDEKTFIVYLDIISLIHSLIQPFIANQSFSCWFWLIHVL